MLWKGIEFLCSVRCIRHISLVKRHDIENEDMIVTTIDGKYPWLSVTQIFPIGQPSHDADRNIFKVMTSNTDSVAAAHDQRSPGSNQKL